MSRYLLAIGIGFIGGVYADRHHKAQIDALCAKADIMCAKVNEKITGPKPEEPLVEETSLA